MCSLQEHIEREIRQREAEREAVEIEESTAEGWQPGDVAFTKKHGEGWLVVRDRKGVLGIRDGVDGWRQIQVVPDGPMSQGVEAGPHGT